MLATCCPWLPTASRPRGNPELLGQHLSSSFPLHLSSSSCPGNNQVQMPAGDPPKSEDASPVIACDCPHPLGTQAASQSRPCPVLPVLFSGQGRECSSRDLRTSGMSMAGATPIQSQLDMACGRCFGGEFRISGSSRSWPESRRLWRRAGWEPEAANGQHEPWPACPPPARPLASSSCSQASPSRCLAGRA